MGMEMPCNECGGKSPMGAIFCRECGAKLDVEEMAPKVISKSTDGGFKFTRLAVRRLISLAISIVVFGTIAMMFMNDAPGTPGEVPDSAVEQLEKIHNVLTGPKAKGKSFTVNEDALTHYIIKQLDEMQEMQVGQEEGGLYYNECIFDFYDDNMIKIDLQSTMTVAGFKKEISNQLIVSFENTDDGIVFNVESGKHGKIPIPSMLREKFVTSRFERLVPGDDTIEDIIDKIKSITMSDDSKIKIEMKK